jgi:glyoxylase-like metal-dependent hydrolase (beta-lactamase superfamily II)
VSIKFGRFILSVINFGFFRLDGGSMFGSVPKNLWEKAIQPDAENCIRLACRCLLLEDEARKILIDVGMGEKWNEKARKIYGIQNTPEAQWGFAKESITDVILTHLHFDHAGGITTFKNAGSPDITPTFPSATIHLQKANWEHANAPTLKDRASYLPENVTPLAVLDLRLYDGSVEILPDIWGHRVDGHTRGQQWIEIRGDSDTLMFATDLIPTSHHLPLPYHMGFDVCAETLLKEKEAFLSQALNKNALVFFEHDPEVAAARVVLNDRGHYTVGERVLL